MVYSRLKSKWLPVVCKRGTMTYRHGKLDFRCGEGGNNHIYLFDENGVEIGYMWFDTHTYQFGFIMSARGYFNTQLEKHVKNYPTYSYVTPEFFDWLMYDALAQIR